MKFVADESLERQIVERLRRDGHDVYAITETEAGIRDDDVLARANERGAVLVTEDKDFGELVYRRRQVHEGIVLLRLSGLAPDEKAEIVSQAIERYSTQVTGAFTVVTPVLIRIRHHP